VLNAIPLPKFDDASNHSSPEASTASLSASAQPQPSSLECSSPVKPEEAQLSATLNMDQHQKSSSLSLHDDDSGNEAFEQSDAEDDSQRHRSRPQVVPALQLSFLAPDANLTVGCEPVPSPQKLPAQSSSQSEAAKTDEFLQNAELPISAEPSTNNTGPSQTDNTAISGSERAEDKAQPDLQITQESVNPPGTSEPAQDVPGEPLSTNPPSKLQPTPAESVAADLLIKLDASTGEIPESTLSRSPSVSKASAVENTSQVQSHEISDLENSTGNSGVNNNGRQCCSVNSSSQCTIL